MRGLGMDQQDGMKLSDLKGKVVVDFFQLWCPGCNAYLIPLIKF